MAVKHQNQKNNILLGQNNNALTWLIIINAVVFVLLFTTKVFYEFHFQDSKIKGIGDARFQQQVMDWFVLPSNFKMLATRPWTLLTYMFVHSSPLQLLSSTLWLWSFGYIMQDLAGNSKLAPLYLYGGLAGGIFYLIGSGFFPAFNQALQPFITGSAAVMTIAIATTVLSPGYRIFPMINGGIPVWILTAAFVIIEFSTIAITNPGFAFGHVGAALLGVMYIYQLRRGRDMGAWMLSFATWTNDLFNPEKKLAKQSEREKLFYKSTKKPFVKKTVVTQQRVDELLDKINQKGYHFLTDEEKDFLKKASEQEL